MSGSRFALTLPIALLVLVAGCVQFDPVEGDLVPDGALAIAGFETGTGTYELEAVAGGLSELRLTLGGGAPVEFDVNVLVQTADGALVPVPAGESIAEMEVGVDRPLRFILPPGAERVTIHVGGEAVGTTVEVAIPTEGQTPRETFVSGEHVIELMEIQERDFPHRTPGHENYAKAQAYFAEYFEALGYEVEVDPYGTMAFDDTRLPAGPTRGIGPSSVANVVAYKKGTAAEEKFLVFGGHYDAVEETVHAAFDNTAGSMAVMELARAFAGVPTEHTLVFALWGGEEDGILGSRFWVETNPDKAAATTAYVNLDVTGAAWPGPLDRPDPIDVTAGPDGVLAQRLLGEARVVIEDWARFADAPVLYEEMVQGQATGAGVNAQSDHTSFATNGVPSFFVFNGNVDMILGVIHDPADTLYNMTAYMVTGTTPYDGELTPQELELGRDLLARSFEAQMYIPFYYALLVDAGAL